MDIKLEPKKLGEVDSDALVVIGFDGTPPDAAAAAPPTDAPGTAPAPGDKSIRSVGPTFIPAR